MSYVSKNLKVEKLSVIGAGQIGPDIALHFSKVFAGYNVPIILVDISPESLQRAQAKIEKKISKGVESGSFKPELAQQMNTAFTYTDNYDEIRGSTIVLEAATEDENIKDKIFKLVESLTDDNCLFLSNSSHMQPEVIFRNIKNKSRCLVTHYFFPAERNPVVEVVPGPVTDQEVVNALMRFYEDIGKVPIKVKSSYGYAVDPIFEGLCQAAIMMLENGMGTVKEIDKIGTKSLGLGVGPFTALNLTGGNPITNHGLDEMKKLVNPWFGSPKLLRKAVEENTAWPTASRGEEVVVSPEKEKQLTEYFQGAYFALAAMIIDMDICDINDLEMATEMSLVIRPPFSFMNKIGIDNANQLVENFCKAHAGFKLPTSIGNALKNGGWKLCDIVREDKGEIAVLTIRRPKYLNALNEKVINDLREIFMAIESDQKIKGAVITGFGPKAFVSGADINMLSKLKTPEEGYNNARTFQLVLNYIEKMTKPVVCAYNGIAFGGGNELAMACTTRISKKGMPVLISQPEVKLGIIPGAGGTQRLPRLIGIAKASELLRTGKSISSAEAVKLGLTYKETDGDLVEEAVQLAKQLADGTRQMDKINMEPMQVPDAIPAIDLGHLSKRIDGILTRAIWEGAKLNLEKGLDLEARLFGECLTTEDMKIGLKTFKEQGPRAKAEFVHK